MANALEGKSALITGCGSGIGRATSLAFARAGASVTCADVDQSGGEATVAMIREAQGVAEFVRSDVTDANQVQALINRIVSTHGRLDCAYNNAGIEGDVMEVHEASERNFDRLMAVNVNGALICSQAALPYMRQRGGGRIINQVSGGAFPAGSGYGVSKLALVGVTTTLARELGPEGIDGYTVLKSISVAAGR